MEIYFQLNIFVSIFFEILPALPINLSCGSLSNISILCSVKGLEVFAGIVIL
jgi:hypothetical protein